jgi:DNA-binding XRE family transcriptional regulator
MSKSELAKAADLSIPTIDRVEKGHPCRMETKRKIIKALGLTLDERNRVFLE